MNVPVSKPPAASLLATLACLAASAIFALLPAHVAAQGGAAQGGVAGPGGTPLRQPTVVRLPMVQENAAGELVIQPNVGIGSRWSGNSPSQLQNQPSNPYAIAPAGYSQPGFDQELPPPSPNQRLGPTLEVPSVEMLPEAAIDPEQGFPGTLADPWYSDSLPDWNSGLFGGGDRILPDFWHDVRWHVAPLTANILFGPARFRMKEPGVGRERLAFTQSEIDVTQPQNNRRIRFDSTYNLTLPDRSEFFWARAGTRGPGPERSVDFQEFRYLHEIGGGKFSTAMEFPVRLLNPELNGNNAGFGDIKLTTKLVLLDGNDWQISQITRTTFNNGNARKGLGTGHTSMEPGFLFRYKWSDLTFVHSELKMNFPIGGDPTFSAPVLRWGVGLSHLYYENDSFALIQSLEFINIWILDGQKTLPPAGPVPPNPPPIAVDVEAEGIFNLMYGMKLVCDTGGDLGIVEFGLAGGVGLQSTGWYEGMVRFDMQFPF